MDTDGAVQDAAFRLLAAPPRRWPAGGTEGSLVLPGVAVAVRVESEEGRVNPNLASAELLAALMRAAGADTQSATTIAAAIVEWRFPGAAEGAAMRAYRTAGLAYGPPGKPFRSLDELGAVRGMTPALLAALTPYLSLFATGDPDAADAAPVVLAAMRAATGRAPRSERGGAPPSVVRVTAAAIGPNGARFTRRAVLALNRRNAAPVRVLNWDAPGAWRRLSPALAALHPVRTRRGDGRSGAASAVLAVPGSPRRKDGWQRRVEGGRGNRPSDA